MSTITLSKSEITEKDGIVILSLKEYRKICERVVPEYYLTGKAAEEADKLVKEGLVDYREGRTKKIKSLADLE